MVKSPFLICICVLLAITGCRKPAKITGAQNEQVQNAEASAAPFDACSLIANNEIEAIEGSPVRDTKNSGRFDGGLSYAQCFYTTKEFSRSVSLAVTQADPRATPRRKIKELWEQTFGQHDEAEKKGSEKEPAEKEEDREKRESLRSQRGERGEEEEHKALPKKVDGIGEEAFWAGTRVGGALYVLKKEAYVRVSVGGPDPEEKKIEKCKALAQKALSRL